MTQWSKICAVADIPRLGARVAEIAGTGVAVFRTEEDYVFALRDHCPHKGGPLSQGIVHGEQVTCPLHGWVIGLRDGGAELPNIGCTLRYEVRVADGEVWVEVTSPSLMGTGSSDSTCDGIDQPARLTRQAQCHPRPLVIAGPKRSHANDDVAARQVDRDGNGHDSG